MWIVLFLPAAGSYVALTVQGRPPGSPQIPLADSEVDLAAFGHMSPIMTSPHSPGTSGNAERITSPVLMGVRFKALFPKDESSSGRRIVVYFFLNCFALLQITDWKWNFYPATQWAFAHMRKNILQVKISSLIWDNTNALESLFTGCLWGDTVIYIMWVYTLSGPSQSCCDFCKKVVCKVCRWISKRSRESK